jgi:hypothetical protein
LIRVNDEPPGPTATVPSLIAECRSFGAKLLVIGSYGCSLLRELLPAAGLPRSCQFPFSSRMSAASPLWPPKIDRRQRPPAEFPSSSFTNRP